MTKYYKFDNNREVIDELEKQQLQWEKQYAVKDTFCFFLPTERNDYIFYSCSDNQDNPIFSIENVNNGIMPEEISKDEFVSATTAEGKLIGRKWFHECRQ